jgi:general secretion pathway protein E
MSRTEGALVGKDVFSPGELALAKADAVRAKRRVVEALDDHFQLSPDEFAAKLAATLRYPCMSREALQACEADFARISYPETVAHECLPFRNEQGLLCVAFCDPFDPGRQAWANEQLRESALWVLVHRVTLQAMFAKYEAGARAMDDVLALDPEQRRVSEAIEDLSIKSISEGTSPVVKLVHSTIYDAFKLGASDIHLEAGTSDLTIKYRIDGVLLKVKVVEGKEMAEQAISRIKVMSELDISERRIPQDGRFKLAVLGRAVDFRVSVMPSIHGEDSVIRILDKQSLSQQSQGLRLDMIGFDEQTVLQIRGLASEPYGLMLVTGPTGSGKTTSLYAVLNELNQGQDKIITIEDPVEYQLPGILQIPVNEKKGLTFSRGLRSILRHDPDKIMVGEIRDSETAQIAVQSALTGHLVLATVHANNVLDIIGRFIHMGVEPYNFVSALNGVIAQRLLRVLCPHCIEPYHPDSKLLAASRLTEAEAANFSFRTGRGCKDCYGTGYKGRRAIAEVLLLTDEIREQIIAKEPIRRIKDTARATGTRFLRESAMDLVRQGITTLEEINRVTFVG